MLRWQESVSQDTISIATPFMCSDLGIMSGSGRSLVHKLFLGGDEIRSISTIDDAKKLSGEAREETILRFVIDSRNLFHIAHTPSSRDFL